MTRRTVAPSTEIHSNLSKLMDDVNMSQDAKLMFLEGTTGRWPDDRTIRSGSLGIDMSIGIGGLPRGRITEVFGEYSCGKTTLALHAVREAQASGGLVVYIDAENTLEPNYMRRLGVDTSQMLVSQTNCLEEAIDLMVLLMEQDKTSLIVLDSIPSLKARATIEASADEEGRRAAEASVWSKNLPKVVNRMQNSSTALLMINQTRASMDMYKPYTTPGGEAIKFNASVRMHLRPKVEGKKEDGMDYQKCFVDIIKNKVGSPFRKATFFLPPGEPIDFIEDTMIQAVKHGVVLEDKKFESYQEMASKKGWYTMPLTPDDIELARKDDPELEHMGKGFDPDDFPYLQGYRFNQFLESQLRTHPALVEAIENRVLNTLNDPDASIPDESESSDGESGSAGDDPDDADGDAEAG